MSTETTQQPDAAQTQRGRVSEGLVPPIDPVDIRAQELEFEKGVLFSDPDLTAWWWNTHEFMTNADRHKLATLVVPRCTSAACGRMMAGARDELGDYLAPVSTVEALRSNLAALVQQRPYFSGAIAVSFAYFCVAAGMRIFSFFSA